MFLVPVFHWPRGRTALDHVARCISGQPSAETVVEPGRWEVLARVSALEPWAAQVLTSPLCLSQGVGLLSGVGVGRVAGTSQSVARGAGETLTCWDAAGDRGPRASGDKGDKGSEAGDEEGSKKDSMAKVGQAEEDKPRNLLSTGGGGGGGGGKGPGSEPHCPRCKLAAREMDFKCMGESLVGDSVGRRLCF